MGVQKTARRSRTPQSWKPVTDRIVLRPSADALADPRPLLARIIGALGTNAAARLLGADRAQVSRWSAGKEPVGAEMGRRIVDLHDVLTRILRIYDRHAAAMWLLGSEPLLGGARPIDVLAMEGAAPVIRTIEGIAQGAYALVSVPLLYRVLPFLADAAPNEPGGALYVPQQGGGRLDNPDLYAVMYLSDAAAGAIAEAFGRFPEWSAAILAGSPSLPGSMRALATYRLSDQEPLCDLDDPKQLQALRLRPSEVVSRDYGRTRAWARRIYEQHQWIGVRWWSYYDPRWASVGLWDTGRLKLEDVHPLRLDDAALVEASHTIVRRIIESPRT